jgi:hypothetical protein
MQAAIAYTSASPAENQKLSENVNINEPIKLLDKTAILVENGVSLKLGITLRNNKVIDQNKNRTANALEKTDIKFTIRAIWSALEANKEKKAPKI